MGPENLQGRHVSAADKITDEAGAQVQLYPLGIGDNLGIALIDIEIIA